MKNNLFSYVLLSLLLSAPAVQATVYAVGMLQKGNQKVYFFSDVPDTRQEQAVQDAAILSKARELGAKLIIDDSYKVLAERAQGSDIAVQSCYSRSSFGDETLQAINDVLKHEAIKITDERFNKSTIGTKYRLFSDFVVANPQQRFGDCSQDQQEGLMSLCDVITRNQLINAVETSDNEHMFVFSSPVHICVTWNKLKEEGWRVSGAETVVSFAQAFAESSEQAGSLGDAARLTGAKPVNIEACFAPIEPQISVPVAQPEPIFTLSNVGWCLFGCASIAALACIAIKNDFFGWMKNKVGPSLLKYGIINRNLSIAETGLRYAARA